MSDRPIPYDFATSRQPGGLTVPGREFLQYVATTLAELQAAIAAGFPVTNTETYTTPGAFTHTWSSAAVGAWVTVVGGGGSGSVLAASGGGGGGGGSGEIVGPFWYSRAGAVSTAGVVGAGGAALDTSSATAGNAGVASLSLIHI